MGLGAYLQVSTELADYHRTMVMATQCIGGDTDLTAQNGQSSSETNRWFQLSKEVPVHGIKV